MCGICGIYKKNSTESLSKAVLEKMMQAIAHRGPDDTGCYIGQDIALGHTRLSIIDLKHGHQPMTNERGNIQLTYNGEIYNFAELKAELAAKGHIFKTDCDTEVVVHGYEEWGPQCVTRFNGMFAFALWDETAQTLFLARDRLGIKPLYYTSQGNLLLFASEIKSLLVHPAVRAEVETDSIPEYLFCTALLNGNTMFRNIHYLPPGYFLLCRDQKESLCCYWDLPICGQVTNHRQVKELSEDLFHLLDDAVHRTLMSDVPFGSLLSGGLDSSFIAGLATRHVNHRLKTFAMEYTKNQTVGSGSSDTDFARLMARAFDTDHKEYLLDPVAYQENLKQVTWQVEKPIELTTPSVYLLYKNLREDVKVVLSGEGADELFGGYFFFLSKASTKPLVEFPWAPYFNEVAMLLDDKLADTTQFKDKIATELNRLAGKYASDDWLNTVLCLFIKIYLLEMLERQDKTSMAWSVESRVPYLDHRLVEMVVNLPSYYKLKGDDEKHLLKEAARPFLPAEITSRKKKPFPFPVDPKSIYRQKNRANELVQSGKSHIARYFKRKETDDFFNKRGHFGTLDNLAIFRTSYAMIALELWHEVFGV